MAVAWLKLASVIFVTSQVVTSQQTAKPNIVMVLVDDLGWADVNPHDPKMFTPTISWLAQQGVTLNQSYTLMTCAPSRSSILTGRYPYKYGMALNKIKGRKLHWLKESMTLLPAAMKKEKYRTHMIGKWHLGYCNWALVPTRRGFDTFYGFYSGEEGYYNHSGNNEGSYDFRDQDEVVLDPEQTYATLLHTARAQKIFGEHGPGGQYSDTPFFMYLSHQSVHAPFEAPRSYIDQHCSQVVDEARKLHCGMVAVLDESLYNVTDTLKKQGLWNNTILVFLSDNGGPGPEQGSYNYPLRGKKATLWEGGVRSYTIVYNPFASKNLRGVTYRGLVHSVDWFPTFVEAAGGTPPQFVADGGGFDGMSQWGNLNTLEGTNRQEFVYNIDSAMERHAYRYQNFKLTIGRPGRGFNAVYPLPWISMNRTEPDEKDVPKLGLWDIENDPGEMINLYPKSASDTTSVTLLYTGEVIKVVELTERMKEALKRYTQHEVLYPEDPESSKLDNAVNGVLSPGWCSLSSGDTSATTSAGTVFHATNFVYLACLYACLRIIITSI